MLTAVLGFVLLALVIAGMSVGVLMGRRPIAGSCGGIGAALGEKDYTCDICGDDPQKCEEQKSGNQTTTANLSYDASKKETSSQ